MSNTSLLSGNSSISCSHDRKKKYRALLEDLIILEEDTGNDVERMERTSLVVREAEELLSQGSLEERAKHPGEGYLDSRVMRASSDVAVRCSESVSGNVNVYDKHELARHIREKPDFWGLLFPGEVPSVAFLYGTFEAAAPAQRCPRPSRERPQRQRAAALQVPETVDRLEKTEEGPDMVTRINRFINKAYRSRGDRPLNYFQLVLDPDSFSRSVENIYYLSFLVRDGLVSVHVDEQHGLPFVTPLRTEVQKRHDLSDDNQFIVSLDIQRWNELIAAFKINKALMVRERF